MLYKLWQAFLKEFLLVWRDIGGIVIIFVMPLIMIITVTMIQDSTFKNMEGGRMPVAYVDLDKSPMSESIRKSITESGSFDLIPIQEEKTAREAVFSGKYQMGIVIPKNLDAKINGEIHKSVRKIVESFGAMSESAPIEKVPAADDLHLYFDPATNEAFKMGMKTAIRKMVFEIENKKIYTAFQDELGVDDTAMPKKDLIQFKEISPVKDGRELHPNTVQHNVPAWALFAMFFIVVPLSINIVKEKNQGTIQRLRSSPTPYFIHILGKTLLYLIICIIQFLLMLAVGIYIFPMLGLPAFELNGNFLSLIFVTVFAGLAAVGFGILIGTLSETQEQSAPLGATSVVILAALGGIWVPVFMMPAIMQTISVFSPMNWGLNAYYDIILRNSGIVTVLPKVLLLLAFYFVMAIISIIYERRKHSV